MEDAFSFLRTIMAKKQCTQDCCNVLSKALDFFFKDAAIGDDIDDDNDSSKPNFDDDRDKGTITTSDKAYLELN